MNYELFVANRYLRSKRKTGFISLISYISIAGVMIGVAALIIVLSVMNGFENHVRSKIIGFQSHLRLRTFHDRGIENYQSVIGQISDMPEIQGMTPYILEKGFIRSTKNTEGLVIKGIDYKGAEQVTNIHQTIKAGEFNVGPVEIKNGKELPGIVLGYNLADKLYVKPGDFVHLMGASSLGSSFGRMPRMDPFIVTGIFETGLFEFDDTYAYISIESTQRVFDLGSRVSGIEIKLDDINKSRLVSSVIDEKIGYPYRTLTWFEMNRNLFAWMKIQRWTGLIVLSLIILVAAFNIISTLIMVVLEKNKDIGVLKALGASSKSIQKIFVYEGLFTGVIGTILGSVLGYALCWSQLKYEWFSLPGDVYLINVLPILMQWTDFAIIGGVAIVLCFLATIFPASRAASLDPVEAIRYE